MVNRSSRSRFAIVIAAVLVVASVLFWGRSDLPRYSRAEFVITEPAVGLRLSPTWKDKLRKWLEQRRARIHPQPDNHTFPPNATNRCAIAAILDQCMHITVTRYVIDKDIASGNVLFGYTNTMKGSAWGAAFENALEPGTIEYWSPDRKGFRHESPILIRYPEYKTVFVVPPKKADRFQRKL